MRMSHRRTGALVLALALIGAMFALPSAASATSPPVNKTPPTISPVTPKWSQPAKALVGTWTEKPTSYAYQWRLCNSAGGECADISGATGSEYTPTKSQFQSRLVVKVTATNAAGSGEASSAPSNPIYSPTSPLSWRIGGRTLAELGISSEYVESWGAVTLEVTNGLKISCSSSTGSGKISGTTGGELTINPSGCAYVGIKGCTVSKMQIGAKITLTSDVNGVYERLSGNLGGTENVLALEQSGIACPWIGAGLWYFGGSLAAQPGNEAVSLSQLSNRAFEEATGSWVTMGSQQGFLTGAQNWQVSGANNGSTLGAW